MSTTKSKTLEVAIELSPDDSMKCRPDYDGKKGCQFHAHDSEGDYSHCCLFNVGLGDSLGGELPRCTACLTCFGN